MNTQRGMESSWSTKHFDPQKIPFLERPNNGHGLIMVKVSRLCIVIQNSWSPPFYSVAAFLITYRLLLYK